jgi:hypothetical protein
MPTNQKVDDRLCRHPRDSSAAEVFDPRDTVAERARDANTL